MDIVSCLNAAQKEAVLQTEGPLLVLAGAGTGKTRVLVARLVHILSQKKAHSQEVLAVTFTNKAALEMKERIAHLWEGPLDGLWLGTFHSIGARILRRHAETLGFTQSFSILDTSDQERTVRQLLQLEHMENKRQTVGTIAAMISGWKDRGLMPHEVTEEYLGWERARQALHIYKMYQERLKFMNAMDFGDLLLNCLSLFRKHRPILELYQQRFKYILVDEYQDTNVVQYLWLRLLAEGSKNICCVGDDDQSIYGWRGAEVGNILRFERDFPGATLVRLEQNYRSSPAILGAASSLIAHNTARLGKMLWTEQEGGEPVFLKSVWDHAEEATWVAREVERLHRLAIPLSEMAVLVRAGFQTREFEEVLLTLGIAYHIVGGVRFYERQEIRDALAYLRLVAEPKDDLAFERAISAPKRGLGKSTLQKMHTVAQTQKRSLFEVAEQMVSSQDLKGKTSAALSHFLQDVTRWHKSVERESPEKLAKIILDESGYTFMWKQEKSIEAEGRLENLKEFVSALTEFSSLHEFLEHVSLVTETAQPADKNSLGLMTMHAAKGLEFKVVFLAGWEEGVFPSQRTLMEGGTKELEEERRLAYVALTRAKESAYILYAANRRVHGQWQHNLPSRFISELSKEHVLLLGHKKIEMGKGGEILENLGNETLIPHKRGKRVQHHLFGQGTVQKTLEDRLVIHFDDGATRTILARFLTDSSGV